jgi:hypothetical protein
MEDLAAIRVLLDSAVIEGRSAEALAKVDTSSDTGHAQPEAP